MAETPRPTAIENETAVRKAFRRTMIAFDKLDSDEQRLRVLKAAALLMCELDLFEPVPLVSPVLASPLSAPGDAS